MFTQMGSLGSERLIANLPLVIINDLLSAANYPVLGRVTDIECDTNGSPRWYTLEYKGLQFNPQATKAAERLTSKAKFSVVRSLLLLLPTNGHSEQVLDNTPVTAPIEIAVEKKKITVKVLDGDTEI